MAVGLEIIGAGLPEVPREIAKVEAPPPPAGVAHVASPRQNVLAEADVPLLRFPTGRLPTTCVDRLTLDTVITGVAPPVELTPLFAVTLVTVPAFPLVHLIGNPGP